MMMLDFKPNGSNQVNEGPLIKLSQVVKTYHGLAGDVTALKGVDLEVRAGEFVAITGKSGSGKTTLINVMLLSVIASFIPARNASQLTVREVLAYE
jgi:ABC-type multidrug transport system ATPase subunit